MQSVWHRQRIRRRGSHCQRIGREDIPLMSEVCVIHPPCAATMLTPAPTRTQEFAIPLTPHQVATPRLAHPSRVRLGSTVPAHFAAGDRDRCRPGADIAGCNSQGGRVDLAGRAGTPRGGVRAQRGRAVRREGCWRAGG
jgi:hypothetical protein